MVIWATKSGNWSDTTVWSSGSVPTSADDVYSNSFTVNMDSNATVISLNNSTTPLIVPSNQIPIMTSNTTPSGIASASSNSSQAYLAFDQNTATSWVSSGAATGQLVYQFPSGIVAKRYSVRSIGGTTNAPRDWTFQGSNDGISWTTLETVTGQNYGATGNYTSPILANILSYTRYRLNITANNGAGTTLISDFEITDSTGTGVGGASGGSFNFNTAGVSVTCTSTSASLSAGATNLITVTATTGTVTLNLGSSVTGLNIATTQIFNHTGNCNFNLNGIRFTGGLNANTFCINKSSTGVITITGDLVGGGQNNGPAHALNSTAGNTVVIGNVFGFGNNGVGHGISQTAGNVTVTGNVTGGIASSTNGISLTGAASQFTINGNVTGGSGAGAHGINFGGTLGTVNGNVTGGGGSGARGISTDTGGVNVTGNVTGFVGIGLVIGANSTIIGNIFGGSSSAGINTAVNNSFTVTVTGDVYASNTAPGIVLTGTGTQVVNLTGNMYNSLGRMAIWCPNVFISNTSTTLWRVDTGGGDYKFLYSADTTPNLPATTNVRSGVTFGPALSLTGTMVVPAASDVRENVPVDNTVGTGELTSADIISGINASSDPLAVRLKNALTDVTAGNLISQYKDS